VVEVTVGEDRFQRSNLGLGCVWHLNKVGVMGSVGEGFRAGPKVAALALW
jgi:hypothetical protein